MSDGRRRSITSRLESSAIQRFAAAKFAAGTACPRCAADSWEYQDETLTNEMMGLSVVSGDGRATGLYASILFRCNNCGFVAPHAKNIIVDWLNDHE